MTNDTLRAAITAALKRRDPNADLDVSPTCTPLGAWGSIAGGVIRGPDGAVIDVVARASDDAKALRGVAFAVGMRVDPCPACNGRGRLAYGRETEDGCDECECSGVVANDPAEEVKRYRTIAGNLLARIHRDGGHHADAIGWERAADEADMIVARLFVERDEARAEVDRLRAELSLERDRCAGLVREIHAGQPGARATAARRWFDDRVAACVRDILCDDETATCARSLVREARERAKAAEADVARLEFALQCEATRHEATRAAVREYLSAVDALTIALVDDSDAGDAVAMLARMHVARTRRDEALSRLRALVSL